MLQDLFPIGEFKEIENPSVDDFNTWILKIQKTPQLLKNAVSGFGEEDLELTYRKGGWTIRQIVHHIADNDMNVYFRFKRTLTEESPVLPSYDQGKWAELGDYKEPIEVSMRLIEAIYQRLISMLKEIDTNQLKRMMTSSTYGVMNLETVLQRFLWHDRHHIAQIDAIRKKKGLPTIFYEA